MGSAAHPVTGRALHPIRAFIQLNTGGVVVLVRACESTARARCSKVQCAGPVVILNAPGYLVSKSD